MKPHFKLSFSQEMFKEFAKWKAKTEERLMEISNAVTALQASRQ